MRTVLTTLAVVFGVAVIFGVNILLPTLAAALQGSVLGARGQADLTDQQRHSARPSPPRRLDTVRASPACAAASAALRRQVNLGADDASDVRGGDRRGPGHSRGRAPLPAWPRAASCRPAIRKSPWSPSPWPRPWASRSAAACSCPRPQGLTELTVVGLLARPARRAESSCRWRPRRRCSPRPAGSTRLTWRSGAGADRDAVKAALQAGSARATTSAASRRKAMRSPTSRSRWWPSTCSAC